MQTVLLKIKESAYDKVLYLLRKLEDDVEIVVDSKKKQKELKRHQKNLKEAIKEAMEGRGVIKGKLGEL